VSKPCFLLVDDHALFRAGLGLMLLEHWPGASLLTASHWREALAQLQSHRPDLILLDVHLPDAHSVGHLSELRGLAPDCPVLLLSSDVAHDQVELARRAGAAGFLPKSATTQQVQASVQACLRGEQAYALLPYETLSRPFDRAPLGVADGAGLAFNPSQLQILRYLGKRTPNKAMAQHMGMSENAIRAEVSWLTECLQATSRQEAYEAAVARGLLPPQ
jgi:two-component system nitrate/nitrite response regulator NarL